MSDQAKSVHSISMLKGTPLRDVVGLLAIIDSRKKLGRSRAFADPKKPRIFGTSQRPSLEWTATSD